MLQWFIRFPGFAEFNESSAPFRKLPNIVNSPIREKDYILKKHYGKGTVALNFSLHENIAPNINHAGLKRVEKDWNLSVLIIYW